MSEKSKIITTVITVVIAIILFALVVGMRENSGNATPGILGLIVLAGAYWIISGIWKSKKE